MLITNMVLFWVALTLILYSLIVLIYVLVKHRTFKLIILAIVQLIFNVLVTGTLQWSVVLMLSGGRISLFHSTIFPIIGLVGFLIFVGYVVYVTKLIVRRIKVSRTPLKPQTNESPENLK
ncbi:MAG TPA: hypothetical protein PLO88_02335 [Bacilli bacterium]|nr:MAG: hypothetical protein BWY97_00273 [Tenericutes bacterium ADurb.BinA124]HNZ50470.1 hypothetical protein [Bacilli bacterium]HPN60953.1 hypothetical protein [Bacilli bacterium]HPX83749.1 hypothetical protein [Bacilli bacterium]HQC73948.1 hypothetical protein [Bacilli bacterium]